jgi:hypothetical protein
MKLFNRVLSLAEVVMQFLIGILSLIGIMTVSLLIKRYVYDLILKKGFICKIETDIGEFLFHQRVKNPYILNAWIMNNQDWFEGMVYGVIEYLSIKGITVDVDKIRKPVYIKFKSVGKVGYKDKTGSWIRCYGFQKRGYVELEWTTSFSNEYVKDLLRHEITHYLIYCARPNLSEKSHHEIMNF